MPKISVVLPTYNGSKFLDESIASVVAQTFTDWELIIIDDCSSDSTPEVIERWVEKDARIVAYRNEINLRLPRSLNEGFKYASGEFHTWTSDDNFYREDAFQIMYDALANSSEFDLVYCNINRIDENGAPFEGKSFNGGPALLYFFNVVQACFLYRSNIYEELSGYSPDLFLVEDYDFWIRANRSHKFLHLDVAPYFYRMHKGSLTSTRAKDIRKKACELLGRELDVEGLSLVTKLKIVIALAYNRFMFAVSR